MANTKNSSTTATTNTNKQKKPTPPKLITKFDSRPIELQPIAEASNGNSSPAELSPTSSSLLRLLPSGIISKFSSPTSISPLSPSVYTPSSFSWGSRVASSIWSRSSVSSPADGRTSPWEWKFPQPAAPQAQLALDGVGGQFVEEEVEGGDKKVHTSLTPVTPRIFINEDEWRSVSDSHSVNEAAVEEASVEVAELPATGLEAVELAAEELADVELESSDSSLYQMPVRQVGVQSSSVQQPEGSFPSSSSAQDNDVTRPRIGRGRVGSISRIKSFIQRLHSRLENEVPAPSEETPECEDTETGYGIREYFTAKVAHSDQDCESVISENDTQERVDPQDSTRLPCLTNSFGPEVVVADPGMEVTPSESPCSFPEAISRYDGLYPATGYSVEPLPEAIMSAESTYESYVQSVRAFLGGISRQSGRSRFSAQRATRLWRQLVQRHHRRRVPPGLDLESGFPIGEEMPPRVRNHSAPSSPTLPSYAELGGIVDIEYSPPPDLFERSVFPHPDASSRAAGGRLGFLPFFSRAGGAAVSCSGGDSGAPNLIEDLFGPAIVSHSRTEPLQRTYLRQLDLKVSRQRQQLQAWPRPFDYLVSHLALVAKSLRQSYSLEAFRLIHDEQLCVRLPKNDHARQATTTATETLPDQLLVFAIEAWLMLDLSPVLDIDGSTPLSLAMIGSDRIEDLVRPLLPAPAPGERLQNHKLAPTEVTAAQLRGWKNMKFVWTSEISEHLSTNLDGERKEIKIYAHVAYCHLHAAAGEGSSLYKMGFRQYQRVLIEIAHTYRLLFAGDEDSRRVFAEMGMAGGGGGAENVGFENIFFLDPEGTKPRDLYYLATDFPVFGERLVRLQDLLLRGKGLRAMWRDDRETLVWWSFWIVVLSTIFGIAVQSLQAVFAGMQVLGQAGGGGGGGGLPVGPGHMY